MTCRYRDRQRKTGRRGYIYKGSEIDRYIKTGRRGYIYKGSEIDR